MAASVVVRHVDAADNSVLATALKERQALHRKEASVLKETLGLVRRARSSSFFLWLRACGLHGLGHGRASVAFMSNRTGRCEAACGACARALA